MAEYRPSRRHRQDSLEVRLSLAFLRGLIALATFPWRRRAPVKRRQAQPLDQREISQRWGDIQTTVGLGGTTHFGASIIAADKLLDFVLTQKGYGGETLGERLKAAQDDLPQTVYHKAWQAHKVRNALVHEVDQEVTSYEAKEAIRNYEDVLRELGAIR